jgi:hypothetical protein
MSRKNKLIICVIGALIICAMTVAVAISDVNKVEDELTTDEEISEEVSEEESGEVESETVVEVKETTTKNSTKTPTTKKDTTNIIEITTKKEVSVIESTTEKELSEVTTDKNIGTESYFYLSDYERRVAECIVMGEYGYGTYQDQVLVAQCILNACLKDNITPSQVRTKYGYAGWKSNPNDSVKKAVSDVFDKGYKITNERILFFYAPAYCYSSWHESQRFVCEVNGHRYFAEW